jgi:hypothetical protein
MPGLVPRLSGSLSGCLRIFYILGVIARFRESFAEVTIGDSL